VQCFSGDGLGTLILISTMLTASGNVSKHTTVVQNLLLSEKAGMYCLDPELQSQLISSSFTVSIANYYIPDF
jgi:hypothetical protein